MYATKYQDKDGLNCPARAARNDSLSCPARAPRNGTVAPRDPVPSAAPGRRRRSSAAPGGAGTGAARESRSDQSPSCRAHDTEIRPAASACARAGWPARRRARLTAAGAAGRVTRACQASHDLADPRPSSSNPRSPTAPQPNRLRAPNPPASRPGPPTAHPPSPPPPAHPNRPAHPPSRPTPRAPARELARAASPPHARARARADRGWAGRRQRSRGSPPGAAGRRVVRYGNGGAHRGGGLRLCAADIAAATIARRVPVWSSRAPRNLYRFPREGPPAITRTRPLRSCRLRQ